MTDKFTNFATSTIADVGGIGVLDTEFSVQGGHGALFPNPSAGESFCVVCVKATGEREIMKCTARIDDTFTVTREQEGTTALIFEENDKVEHRVTAATLSGFMQSADYNQGVFVNNANGNPNLSDTRFAVTPAGVTRATSQTVGPTGSGADHTWTALNDVPTDVDWIEVGCYVFKTGSPFSGNENYVTVHLSGASWVGGVSSSNDNIVASRWKNPVSADSNINTLYFVGTKKVPVASRVFYTHWTGVIDAGITLTIDLTLIGYGYNS